MTMRQQGDDGRAGGWIELTFRVHEEDGQYVAECVELGVSSCGDTLGQAFDAISEATELYVETLEDVDERERVFAERGIVVHPGEPPEHDGEVSIRARPREYVSPQRLRLPAAV